MTPKEHLELIRSSRLARLLGRRALEISFVAQFVAAGFGGASALLMFRYVEHHDRLESYRLCLDQQLVLAYRMPGLRILGACER